jgi:hypothetical protein
LHRGFLYFFGFLFFEKERRFLFLESGTGFSQTKIHLPHERIGL